MILIQIIFGWPGILAFICLATAAVWLRSPRLMLAAFTLSVLNTFYLFGANNWVRWMAFYIPLSLIVSAALLEKGRVLWPRILLVPIYAFYVWLAHTALK